MNPFFDFDVHIFDCDGVILDSNCFKLAAMSQALEMCVPSIKPQSLALCENYFKENFGRSRFHHVEVFFDRFLDITHHKNKQVIRDQVLLRYALFCKEGYRKADVVSGFREVIAKLKSHKYVVSGTEEQELKETLDSRNLLPLFEEVFGSPAAKIDILAIIKEKYLPSTKIAVIGDSLVDLDATMANGLTFFGFVPLSNTPEMLVDKCHEYGCNIINDWSKLAKIS